MNLRITPVLAASLLALACRAEEVVHLKNGFTVKAISHTRNESEFVFQVGKGTLQLASGDIALIEVFPDPPAPVPAAIVNAPAKTTPSMAALLSKAASDEAIDANLIRSVAKIESGMKPQAISSKGALGLMQLMPRTAASLGVNALHPDENALGGAKYLRALLLQYHGNSALALAAYNAGPGAVTRYGGIPPYAETRRYILKVTREYDHLEKLTKSSSSGQ